MPAGPRLRAWLIWAGVVLVLVTPLIFAAASPLLAWRQPIYIAAGAAGVLGLSLIALQPLLIGGYLPGLGRARRLHAWIGGALVAAILVHLAGLWITSPPDVIDALLFRSPAPFAPWGVIAMWAALLAAGLAVFRMRLSPKTWRLAHSALVSVVVVGTVLHAVLIEGTMEQVTKVLVSLFALALLARVIADFRVWRLLRVRTTRSRAGRRDAG